MKPPKCRFCGTAHWSTNVPRACPTVSRETIRLAATEPDVIKEHDATYADGPPLNYEVRYDWAKRARELGLP